MIALINGKRRKGKSTLGYHLAVERAAAVIVWDPNQNYKNPRFQVVYSIEEMDQCFSQLREGNGFEIVELVSPTEHRTRPKPFTLVYVPPEDFTEEDFKQFSACVRKWMSGTYALLLDESDEEIQQKSRMSKPLAWWVRRSPQDPPEVVHVIQMTHSPQDVYTRARNLLTDLYILQTSGQAELDWYESYTQIPEIREMISNLPHRHVIHYFFDAEGNGRIEVWDNPEGWYEDIGSDRSKIPLDKKPEQEESFKHGEEER